MFFSVPISGPLSLERACERALKPLLGCGQSLHPGIGEYSIVKSTSRCARSVALRLPTQPCSTSVPREAPFVI